MTDEDKKLILEWCGWGSYGEPIDPEIDPNFYFKYAYPLIPDNEKFEFLYCWIIEVFNGKDPAEAFGQVLVKLIKGDTK